MISPALYAGPQRYIESAKNILAMIDSSHPSYSMVVQLIKRHPSQVTRENLRQATGTAGNEPRLAAAFEWRLLRANDTLPLLGWLIVSGNEKYRLEKLEP